MSFGEAATCATEADLHTGRARCSPSELADPQGRFGELKIFDIPHGDVRIPLGCFCDNTSSLYNTPITFLSNSRVLEVSFTVTKLNLSEDFADIYFHASYEMVPVPECRKELRLRGYPAPRRHGRLRVSSPRRVHARHRASNSYGR